MSAEFVYRLAMRPRSLPFLRLHRLHRKHHIEQWAAGACVQIQKPELVCDDCFAP